MIPRGFRERHSYSAEALPRGFLISSPDFQGRCAAFAGQRGIIKIWFRYCGMKLG